MAKKVFTSESWDEFSTGIVNLKERVNDIIDGTQVVSKATSATQASKATSATSATYATTATSAGSASKATSATSATYATTATKAGSANSASTATVDSKGQAITGYIKGIGISGKTLTITKGDGTTASYTTQDTNTTYSNYKGATTASSGTAGLVPAATTATRTKFLRGDGTWQTPSSATSATIATSATYATSAGSSSKATSATSATYATTATKAGTATYSTNSAKASSATSATYASTANYAKSAGSASKLSKARTITVNGRVSGSSTFDGSANMTITTTDGQHISNKDSGAYYFELGSMVTDDSGNYGNITITGRIGGWEQSNSAYFEIMMLNRSSARDGATITATVSASGAVSEALAVCDIVVYKSTSNTSAKVYLKTNGYWLYDFDWSAYQHSVTYTGTKVSTTPSGTLVWSLSNAPKTILSSTGVLTATSFSGNLSGTASNATNAATATYATSAGSASKATTCTNAGTATYATSAGSASKATTCTNAGTATYASSAGSASKATSATSATYASTANYAKAAAGATTASKATSATSATYASTAKYSKATADHNHNASKINAGTLSSDRLPTVPITKGGTGATTADNALSNLGLTATTGATKIGFDATRLNELLSENGYETVSNVNAQQVLDTIIDYSAGLRKLIWYYDEYAQGGNFTRNTTNTTSDYWTCYGGKRGGDAYIRIGFTMASSANSTYKDYVVATGCPIPYYNGAAGGTVNNHNGEARYCFVDKNGNLIVSSGATSIAGKYFYGVISYQTKYANT